MNFSNVKRRADPAETSETGKKDWKGGGGVASRGTYLCFKRHSGGGSLSRLAKDSQLKVTRGTMHGLELSFARSVPHHR